MPLPTEPIGSIPRPQQLLAAMADLAAKRISREQFQATEDAAVRDTIVRFEETSSPVISDGEQTKSSFATYPLAGISNLASDGVVIPFADGHTRQLPRLTAGPFRYGVHAVSFLKAARKYAHRPVKQAVISASALSLLYPQDGLAEYPREAFLDDLSKEAERDIRECIDEGAYCVQIDFTEGRLSLKLDPSGGLLDNFVALNNRVLDDFTPQERQRIGVHTCPGGDRDATHSAGVDYAGLLPALFQLRVGRFYVQLASEKDPERVLEIISRYLQPGQTVFIGVIDPINPVIETPVVVRDRVLLAARHLPALQLGTTDDCGFAPFADDASTPRHIAFAKIRARVEGTQLATEEILQ